jgi:hypothetical protein
VLEAPTEPLTITRLRQVTIHGHSYNHGIAVASALRIPILNHLHQRQRPDEPFLRLAEGHRLAQLARLGRRCRCRGHRNQ